MSEMVERVRQAMGNALGFYPTKTVARAAIEVMREPTDAMVNRLQDCVSDDRYFSEFYMAWQAAIDEALR